MGLLSIIRKQKLKDAELRMLVLGLDNAGKTTIIRQIMGADVEAVAPTMGFQIHTFPWKQHTVHAWDVGGQSTLRGFWANYFDKLDVVVWVVDGTSRERMQELYRELREKVVQQDQLAQTYFLVLVNKIDLAGPGEAALLCEQVERDLDLAAEVPRDRYAVRGVSGRCGTGLDGAMDWVVGRFADP